MGGVQSMDILINKFSVENTAADAHKKKKERSIMGLQKRKHSYQKYGLLKIKSFDTLHHDVMANCYFLMCMVSLGHYLVYT